MKPTLEIKPTGTFRRNLKLIARRGYDLGKLETVVDQLSRMEPLPAACRDHPLTGNWQGFRECPIEPDWILIYAVRQDALILVLAATGTHSDLFGK